MEKKTPFKELSKKAKLQYIWDYYKIHIFVTVVVLIFIISMIVHFVTFKEPVLTINLINCSVESEPADLEDYFHTFLKTEGYNTAEEKVDYSSNLYLDMDNPSAYAQDLMSLDVMVASQSSNVIIADSKTFEGLAQRTYFIDVSSYLDDDMMEQYKDDLIYTTDSETNETYPAGIHIKDADNSFCAATKAYDDYVVGLCYSKDHSDAQTAFIDYLLK